jgi:hypothetical protein
MIQEAPFNFSKNSQNYFARFAESVVNTGDHIFSEISYYGFIIPKENLLPVSKKPAVNLPPVSSTFLAFISDNNIRLPAPLKLTFSN